MDQAVTLSGTPRLPLPPGQKLQIHYVVSSHWDREWYLPFQGFRFRLVQMLDQVLENLRSERWACFVMDGQVSAILDYLEIRPEQRERVVAMVKAGRIRIGPWFTMPDERILSGEALIRNLLRGYREARALGAEPMRYGYICDIFGHCAQMPQIFAGMGISQAFVWRGTNDKSHPQVFRWRAPDGSEVLTHKASDDQAYSSARYFVGNGMEAGNDWKTLARTGALKWRADEDARANVPVYLCLEGRDHNVPRAGLIDELDELRRILPDAEVVHSDFLRFAAAIEPYRDQVPVVTGELVAPSRDMAEWSALIQGCMSSHVPMKQADANCEMLLTRWAEPLSAWIGLMAKDGGKPAPAPGFLGTAWRYQLLNHPHDTICGCSIDQVHKDQEYRYDQAKLIAGEVIGACLERLGARQDDKAKGVAVTVVAASAVAGERVATIEVDYPGDMPAKPLGGFPDDPIPCFDVIDETGRRIEYQLHAYVRDARDQDMGALPWGLRGGYRVRLSLPLRHEGIAARHLRIVPRERWYRSLGTQLTAPDTAENEHLAVKVLATGALELRDKATGRTFTDCCVFEDAGDAGDGWYHLKPVNDQRFLSTGFATGISVVADGPLVTTFRIEKRMVLPAGYDWIGRQRGEARREVTITLDVTLRAGARTVACAARFDNTIRDHRLRVLFASGIAGKDCFASQAFTVIRRARGADLGTCDWKEHDLPERDTQGIIGVDDERGGLAILAGEGLHEAGVFSDQAGTIALTLMRAFRKTVKTPSDGRSQLQQPLAFSWVIAPFSGRAQPARLWQDLIAFHTGLRVHAVRSDQPAAAQWFARLRTGDAVLSALKPAEDGDGMIVRVFNPTDAAVADDLDFAQTFASAVEVDHAEEVLAGAVAQGGGTRLALALPPQKIRSFRVRFAAGGAVR